MRTSRLISALSAVAVASAGVMALDIGDELRMNWKMGLLPRQDTLNLQTFEGDVGGVKASAVRYFTSSLPTTACFFDNGDAIVVVGGGWWCCWDGARTGVPVWRSRGRFQNHDREQDQDEGTTLC
ncbi:uncharacterized protein ColSpa_10946 [Colletotrichum spaethianum]|uniref:Uncharacterized protein n=1 Tax=Colletotrichum spaethianum TaxID=700344 RepID=A0AA37PEE3_9PEZI|nr:uncharacterized protein ColSpa_10946 [Colletotrichum spaethianum]GKT50765.1 hypothetical protein ColSpa_10946 [Colletotrichum spaethianum]